MLLGEIIKAYREANNLSMQEFADRADLTKGYISMIERNNNPRSEKGVTPSLKTYSKCAKAMNMTINDLLRMIDGDEHVIVNDEGVEDLYARIGALHGLTAEDVKAALMFAKQMKK